MTVTLRDAGVILGRVTDIDTGSGVTATLQGSTAILSAGAAVVSIANIAAGRLTLESGVPISTSDQTGKTTVYYTPFQGNAIALFDGASTWDVVTFSETSIALGTLTNALPYDVFGYNNAGTLALELLAWTSTSARATALVLQDGVYVKSGDTTRRWLGTFYTTSTTTTADAVAQRVLYNANNQVLRQAQVYYTTSHTYASGTVRQYNGDTAAQFTMLCAWPVARDLLIMQQAGMSANTGITPASGWALDSTTTTNNNSIFSSAASPQSVTLTVSSTIAPAPGFHTFVLVEAVFGGTATISDGRISTVVPM